MTDLSGGREADSPLDLLVVATWFPSVDDITSGRFVADQVHALVATGRVRPAVVSFEPFGLTGSVPFRSRQAVAVVEQLGRAFRSDASVVSPHGVGTPPGVPIARLPVPAAPTRAAGAAYASVHRAAALLALWDGGPRTGFVDPALIHAHTGYPDGAAAARLAERLGRPLIVTEHASTVSRYLASPAQREWYLRAIDRASRFIAVSETLAGELRRALPEQAAKIVVIPNAVPVDDFALGRPAGRVPDQLLFVGYLKETKGIATLLEAFARVRLARPAATLVLVGQAPTPEIQARWEAAVDHLGVAGAVRFAGPADRAGVAAAMAGATLFVHPSPRETFGVVAVEALASGLPVVAADSGGVTEILGPEPSRVGALVRPDDPEALAGAIVATLERIDRFDPDHLRASVTSRFGSRSVAARLLDLYNDVLESPTDVLVRPGAPGSMEPTSAHLPRRARPGAIVGSPAGVPDRVLLAGFDRARVAHVLGAFPVGLRERLAIVTTSGPQELPAGLASLSLIELGDRTVADLEALRALGHGGGRRARIGRFLRNPAAVIRRRILGRGEPALLRAMTTAIAAQVDIVSRSRATATSADGPLLLVGVDGLAILAASAVSDADRLRIAPGGPRWLADRWLSGAPEALGAAVAMDESDTFGEPDR